MRHNMRMLVKDSRLQDGIDVKDNVKGSKSRSQSMKEHSQHKEQRERPRPHELNDKSNLIDLMKEWGRGGKGVKEKSGVVPSAKAIKDTVVVSSFVMEDHVATVNTEDVNVGQTPTSPNVNPKPGLMWLFRWSLLELLVYGLLIRYMDSYWENVVANYVRNTWGKYGLVKSMLNSSIGIFSFQFSSMDGLDIMLENGSWSSYARALIEVRADVELKDNEVLNSVENDVDLGTTSGASNLVSKKVNSSGCLFWNMESSSTSTTHIIEKIDKVERLIIKGEVTLVDDEGKPVTKVDSLDDHDNEDDVVSSDIDMANFLASKKEG
ncbi:hypothetical protein Tco_0012379 [Tanacetum coccineum]